MVAMLPVYHVLSVVIELWDRRDMMNGLASDASTAGYRAIMNCPACNSREGIEVVMNTEGFAKNLLECANCGSVWAAMVEGRDACTNVKSMTIACSFCR